MGEPFIAETQYNDLQGKVAMDGHDGPPLHDLAKRSTMPNGYWPIGFELFRLDPAENGKIPFTLVAARCEEVGATMEEIIKYARTHEEVPVYGFDGQLDPRDFRALFKRIDIKVVSRNLENANVVSYRAPEDVTTG